VPPPSSLVGRPSPGHTIAARGRAVSGRHRLGTETNRGTFSDAFSRFSVPDAISLFRRSLRHVWLVLGFAGSTACIWWLSSIDNFTPRVRIPVMLACWGAFLGLIPPVFLTDEIEGVDPKDMPYAGALGIVALAVPIITVPTATSTVIKSWSDRALDVYRLSPRSLFANSESEFASRPPNTRATIHNS
jgi:hypothetical protein